MKIDIEIVLAKYGYFCLKLDNRTYCLTFVSTVMSMILSHVSSKMMALEQELKLKHINQYKQGEEEKKDGK